MSCTAIRRTRRRFSAQLLLTAFVVLAWPAFSLAQESILVTTTDGSLSLYDLGTYSLQKSFPTVSSNTAITVGVNPRLAFLLGSPDFMTVVDLTIGKEIKRIYNVGSAGIPALTADKKTLIVWDDFNASLDIVDIASLTVTKRINLLPALGVNNAGGGGSVVLAGNKAFLMPPYSDYTHPLAGVVDLTTFTVTAIPYKHSYFNGWTGNAALTPDGKYVAVIGEFLDNYGSYPELLLVNTSTYAITTQMLSIDPDAIVITPNHSDPTKYFGYVTFTDFNSFYPAVAAVDFRPGSSSYGQVLPATEVQMANLSRTDVYGSGLAISSDGSKLAIGGDNVGPPYYNLMAVDTGLMFSDPMHALVASLYVADGAATQGVTVGRISVTPPNSAPTVTGEDGSISNDKPTDITVMGTNFTDGALVRIGKISPLSTTFVDGNTLHVTVPASVPADMRSDLLVTNPEPNNGLDQQYQSGALSRGVAVGLNPAFQPHEQFAVLSEDGSGTIGLFNLGQRSTTTLTTSPDQYLWGTAFSADGAELFAANAANVFAWDASTGQMHGNPLSLIGFSLSLRKPIFSATSPLTGKPILYAAAGKTQQPADIELLLIDADRNSATFNTVIGQIPAGLQLQQRVTPRSQVATPNGKYVYVPYAPIGDGSNLLVFDVVNGSATTFALDRFNINALTEQQPIVSPDGKYLLLHGAQFNYPFAKQLEIFDIFSNPKEPRLVGAITAPRAWQSTGPYAPDMFSCQILANHLFVVSHFSNSLMTFNFNPDNNDFRPFSLYELPANTSYVGGRIALSPDGAYLYVPSNAGNMVLVLDTSKILKLQDPLITTLAATDRTREIVVSPVPPLPVSLTNRQHSMASARP